MIIPLLTLIIFSIACSLTIDLSRPSNYEVVTLEAAQGWTETEIFVGAGDLLAINYLSGMWSPWPGEAFNANGSGGDPNCRCNVMDAVSHAALIGRIGDHPPFLVGESFQRRVGETGQLVLGINDVDLYDNSGSIEVEVTVMRE
jgi:hypothetical protein